MALSWSEKSVATENLAREMKRRGWKLFGYTPTADNGGDYCDLGSWHGCATHARFPGVVVVVHAYSDHQVPEDGCPPYQATRKGKLWHVEALGTIWVQGTGFQECYGHHGNGAVDVANSIEHNAAQVYQTLQKAREIKTKTAAGSTGDLADEVMSTNGVRIWRNRDWIWVKFPDKPTEEILRAMHNLGGAFSRRQGAWYFETAAVRPQLERLLL